MEIKEEALRWISKNIRTSLLLFLLAANVYQYKAAADEREKYRLFYEQVYRTETERTKKWEDIFIGLRGRLR